MVADMTTFVCNEASRFQERLVTHPITLCDRFSDYCGAATNCIETIDYIKLEFETIGSRDVCSFVRDIDVKMNCDYLFENIKNIIKPETIHSV